MLVGQEKPITTAILGGTGSGTNGNRPWDHRGSSLANSTVESPSCPICPRDVWGSSLARSSHKGHQKDVFVCCVYWFLSPRSWCFFWWIITCFPTRSSGPILMGHPVPTVTYDRSHSQYFRYLLLKSGTVVNQWAWPRTHVGGYSGCGLGDSVARAWLLST